VRRFRSGTGPFPLGLGLLGKRGMRASAFTLTHPSRIPTNDSQ
jgi:hypothetical protein